MSDTLLWYKNAIIYEVHVRAFHDSNSDGTGDFPGLIKKLNYITDLGVTAIWLLPFYPSPLKDDGYDISDYQNIHPNYGNLNDFKMFLEEAHKHGLRVITELVINHTSDQHSWFQKARRSLPGSYWREFYVWSETPLKYKEARIIFKDFEPSNWSWDPLAKSYYWHRFYSHQPDLNFDNPEVQKAIFKILDYWLDMGVDGLRLDAVPYLFEREGTSCENLPETHEFLRKLRKHIDERYPDRMLLAEANQWPEDVIEYFGKGDECHMCFHFPLMPRLFMAIKMEDRFTIIDILKQTPEIHENCQWAIFLRNHDELTLEMVTDEERDYMYKVYASDPQAAINLGIRRRLAPLVANDRRQIELLNALLLSMPGTPVLYYGDEIGMGDNIYLGDRNGVRTPFQWSPDRNAGFSEADPQSLYLPLIATSEYHYETINAEIAQKNANSLLWWTKKIIAIRKFHPELSEGKLHFIESDNSKVLSFIRSHENNQILVVINLSRAVQYVELDLSPYKGKIPQELFGLTEFPIISDRPYLLTLGSYAFYWFQLKENQAAALKNDRLALPMNLTFFENPLDNLKVSRQWPLFESVLLQYIISARWFLGKDRQVRSCKLQDYFDLKDAEGTLISCLLILEVSYSEGSSDLYLLPVSSTEADNAEKVLTENPQLVITTYQNKNSPAKKGVFFESTLLPRFGQILFQHLIQHHLVHGLYGVCTNQMEDLTESGKTLEVDLKTEILLPPQVIGTEQSNSSFVFNKKYFLKIYRKMEAGENPEISISRFFQYTNSFQKTTQLLGFTNYVYAHKHYPIGCLQTFVENQGDGWQLMLNELTKVTEQINATLASEYQPNFPKEGLRSSLHEEPPDELKKLAGTTFNWVQILGKCTGEMHLALASSNDITGFIPEPYTPFYQRSLYQSYRNTLLKSFSILHKSIPLLNPEYADLCQEVLSKENEIHKKFLLWKTLPLDCERIRIHGDFHLGQVLYTGKDFFIIDFEGEPKKSIRERVLKKSALKDVAGMLRSFDYLSFYFLRKKILRTEDHKKLSSFINNWSQWVSSEYLKSYLQTVGDNKILPKDTQVFHEMLEIHLLEKALAELNYELSTRPDWVDIPLQGILKILKGPTL